MKPTFKFRFITLRRVLCTVEAFSVKLPGVEGAFEVWPHHAPFMTLLKPGRVEVDQADGETRVFVVERAVVQVQYNQVDVLANRAVNDGEITQEQADQQQAALIQALSQAQSIEERDKLKRQQQYLDAQMKTLSQATQDNLGG